ncbi:hypothetical protein [Chryseobacterium sp. ISL-6]|uniref:hypothetical protein n=1 Tax=Chryseobacterium sp. ISL-6 TaxID=2819143 RepID=UPI001BE8BBC8|nr:hypothetical protein [Chryseobacterium sp. ISL-6]MBT2623507.1 hypothetical protein [Chryseobacterium sp. ISL-6]
MKNYRITSTRTIKHEYILKELNGYLCKRFQYKKEFAHFSFSSGTITACSRKFDIHLRLFDDDKHYKGKETLVVARLFYDQTRKGHGTDFLKFLTQLAMKCGFLLLAFENCNENSRKFVKNFGLIRVVDPSHHYQILVKDLATNLNNSNY